MKGILLLNGEPYTRAIDCENAYVICCDGAYKWAVNTVKIDENVGDFDSLDCVPVPPPTEIFPSEKDFTDGEIALFKLIGMGVESIEIYGGFGGREDHFLGNLHLLYAAFLRNIPAKMLSENTEIVVCRDEIILDGLAGKTVSVLPFGRDLHILGSTGLKYAEPPLLRYGECRGVSNIVEESRAAIRVAQGDCALIIINRGKV